MARIPAEDSTDSSESDETTAADEPDYSRPAPTDRMEDIGTAPEPDEPDPAPEPDQLARGNDPDSGDGRGSGGTGDIGETEPEPEPEPDQPARGRDRDSGDGRGSGGADTPEEPDSDPDSRDPEPETEQPARGGGQTPSDEPAETGPEPPADPEPREPEPEAPETPTPEQGIESTAEFADDQFSEDTTSVRGQATLFEEEIVSQYDELGREDIRIVRDGDELQAELTTTGQEAMTAQQLGVEADDIALTGEGEVVPTTETGQAAVDFEAIEQGIEAEFPNAESFSIQAGEEADTYAVEVTTGEGEVEQFAVGEDINTPENQALAESRAIDATAAQVARGRAAKLDRLANLDPDELGRRTGTELSVSEDLDQQVGRTNREISAARRAAETEATRIDYGPAEGAVEAIEDVTGFDAPETREQRFETEESLPGEEIARDIGEGALRTGQRAGDLLFAEDTGVASESGTAAVLRAAGFENAADQTEATLRNVGQGITGGVGALGQQAATLPYEAGEVGASALDDGPIETAQDLGASAVEAGAAGVGAAARNPARTAGSVVGSAALSAGLFRGTQGMPVAGRASRVALQPFEEAAKVGASRGLIPTRAATAVPGVRRGQMGLETETESQLTRRISNVRTEAERFIRSERGQAELRFDRPEAETETEQEVELADDEALADLDQETQLEQERAQRRLREEQNEILRGEEERIDVEDTQPDYTAPSRGGTFRASPRGSGQTARTPGQIGGGPRGPQQSAFRMQLESETETEAETRLEDAQAAEATLDDQLDTAAFTRADTAATGAGALAGSMAMDRAAVDSDVLDMAALGADSDALSGAESRTMPATETAVETSLELERGLEIDLETELEGEMERELEREAESEAAFESEAATETAMERELETAFELSQETEREAEVRPVEDEAPREDTPSAMMDDVATDVFKNIDQDLQDFAEDY